MKELVPPYAVPLILDCKTFTFQQQKNKSSKEKKTILPGQLPSSEHFSSFSLPTDTAQRRYVGGLHSPVVPTWQKWGGSSKRSSQSHALGMPWSSVGHRCGKSEVLFHISSDTLWLKSPLADLITLPCLLRTAQHRVQTTLLTLQMKTRCGRNWLAFLDRPTMPQLKIKGFSFN